MTEAYAVIAAAKNAARVRRVFARLSAKAPSTMYAITSAIFTASQ